MSRILIHVFLLLSLVVSLSLNAQAEEKRKDTLRRVLLEFLESDCTDKFSTILPVINLKPTDKELQKTFKKWYDKDSGGELVSASAKAGGKSFGFFYSVPTSYNHKKGHPVIICLTYDKGTLEIAQSMFFRYWKELRKDFIILQMMKKEAEENFSDESTACIESALRYVMARYNVQKDRIHLVGARESGDAACQYALKRGDVLASVLTFPGTLIETTTVPGKNSPLFENLKDTSFMFWASKDDGDWGKYAQRSHESLNANGCKSELVLLEGKEQVPFPTKEDMANFTRFLTEKAKTRPNSYKWYFLEMTYPLAKNIELLGERPAEPVEVTIEKGRITLNKASLPMRLFFKDTDTLEGKITVEVNGEVVFDDLAPTDLRSNLLAIHAGYLGDSYNRSLRLEKPTPKN